MSEEISEQSLLTAHCIVSAARAAGYLAEGEPMQSAPEKTTTLIRCLDFLKRSSGRCV